MNTSEKQQKLIDKFCRKIEYQFQDKNLLLQALSHRSIGRNNNERLEFLGDAVLGCVIAQELYSRFPEASEGELSRLRSHLVKKDPLIKLAKELDLGDLLILGQGELRSGGCHRGSILADAMEAIIGAVYLESGFEKCQQWLLKLYQELLKQTKLTDGQKDPKTRLQELLQAKGFGLPEYELIKVTGAAHEQEFHVECRVPVLDKGFTATAVSKNRRIAEQKAAEKLLDKISENRTTHHS